MNLIFFFYFILKFRFCKSRFIVEGPFEKLKGLPKNIGLIMGSGKINKAHLENGSGLG